MPTFFILYELNGVEKKSKVGHMEVKIGQLYKDFEKWGIKNRLFDAFFTRKNTKNRREI